jgi:hypothetical protein
MQYDMYNKDTVGYRYEQMWFNLFVFMDSLNNLRPYRCRCAVRVVYRGRRMVVRPSGQCNWPYSSEKHWNVSTNGRKAVPSSVTALFCKSEYSLELWVLYAVLRHLRMNKFRVKLSHKEKQRVRGPGM